MKLYIPIYSVTLLLSAILLFTVQPMYSKMILPMLGGAPQVWNTAMLFFQICLLGGYAYAHATTAFLGVRTQAILHVILLAIFTIVLPIAIPDGWTPPDGTDPTFWQLSLMAITVGGPFFIVSGSAPMFQRWFSTSPHKDADNPYFLYGASNLGSMSALLLYPILIEPMLAIDSQSTAWMFGYLALIIMTIIAAASVWQYNTKIKKTEIIIDTSDKEITGSLRLKWVALSLVPSSLMLGVTTHITTDIASVPLLWVMPLALYIGTFIIVFSRKPIITATQSHYIFAGLMFLVLISQILFDEELKSSPFALIGLHLTLFFFAALSCHSELSNSKPSAKHLTEFYLIMSLGGAIGGFFSAIIVPQYFIIPIEYQILIGAALMLRFANREKTTGFGLPITALITAIAVACGIAPAFIGGNAAWLSVAVFILTLATLIKTRWAFALACAIPLLAPQLYLPLGLLPHGKIVHQDRNFFGVIRLVNTNGQRILLHGTTNHGTQPIAEEHKLTKLSYYSPSSPLTDVYNYFDALEGNQNMAVLGLGIGVAACYQKDERHFDFYEIDKEIADLAENEQYFTYLSDCGSPYNIILGDGRLKVEEKDNEIYDLILLDAFSSDNVPIHILTKEAIEIYQTKLKPSGALVFNITNRYLDLEPVLSNASDALGIPSIAKATRGRIIGDTGIKSYDAHFFVLSKNPQIIEYLRNNEWTNTTKREGVKLWTDKYSNIVSVLNNKTRKMRLPKNKETE
ncbi:MAG: fused MFS/spermidine synthase [Alphaproteobacteria bacterium]